MYTVPRIGVGVLIVNAQGEILAGRRTSPNAHGQHEWGWCGGHLDFGESVTECAQREAREEAGIEVGELRLLCVNNIIRYERHYIDIHLTGRILSGEPRPIQPEEMDSWGWYAPEALPQPIFEPARLALEAYLSGRFATNMDIPLFG